MNQHPESALSLSAGLGRRSFLRRAAAASLFTGLNILPAGAVPGPGKVSPNAKVRLAVIGCGNRGGQIGSWFQGTGMVDITCVCDVDLDGKHCAGFLKSVPGVPRYRDFRQMFDKEAGNIDAVLVGTADHSHFPICMQAMALGKAVYVEKPMAHTFLECELMIKAAEKFKVVTQMGNQGHSEANYWQFKAWSEAGVIKDVHRVDAYMVAARRWHGWKIDGFPAGETPPPGIDWETWTGTAPMNPYHSRLHPANWRSWYAYGSGAFGDWGPHILDTIHRFLDLGLPEEVTAEKLEGKNNWIFPQASTILFKFPARGPHPACEVRWFDGRGNMPELPPEVDPGTDLGSAGKIIHSKDLVFRGGSHGSTLRIIPEAKFREMRGDLPDYEKKQPDHARNFLLACRGEAVASSPFAVSGPLTQMFTLGIQAQRLGGTIRFDRATKRITSHADGQAMLTGPAPRKGWEQFYKL
jgi:predicted dehydrogenase